MDNSDWQTARLIPTSGIRGAVEQETRATSALLAVMTIVPDFARSLIGDAGAPAGRLDAYTETPFEDDDGNGLRPDGVLRVKRGGRVWTAIVEVKTGSTRLESDQIERYVRLAAREGFDAVITISNTFVAPSAPHPIRISSRILKKVQLHHWSWTHILTKAVILRKRHGDVSDPEQAWILDELIRYLEDERSGALAFEGLGNHWTSIRDAARAGTLRAGDNGLDDIVNRWDQFLRHLCLHLGRDLGTDVSVVISREHRRDPAKRTRDMIAMLATDNLLEGVLRIPDAAGDLRLTANLRARRIRASVEIQAPRSGYAKTRINWLVRQLPAAPDSVRIDASYGRRVSTSELLGQVRAQSKVLLDPRDPRRTPTKFNIALERDMGSKGGRGQGSFVAAVEQLTQDFYRHVVQDLHTWVEPPPKLPDSDPEQPGAHDGSPTLDELPARGPEEAVPAAGEADRPNQ